MARGLRCPDHRHMTTEQPFDQPIDQNAPPGGAAPPRDQPMGINRLRRRTTDRVIGGVAGGLGDYLNVDPILIRVGFVGLMVFGGAGFPLYILAWLLIPAADRQDSIAEATLRRLGGAGVAVAFVLLAGLVFMSSQILDRMGERGLPTEVFWAFGIAVIGLVLVLFRRDDRSRAGANESGFAPVAPASSAPAASGLTWPASTPPGGAYWAAPAAPAKPRERSPLGWYTIAGVLVAVAAVGVVDTASRSTVLPAQYVGAGLVALGIGLTVGAWWGRARLLILVGLLALPFAAASTFLTVPFEGGAGYRAYQPLKVAELRSEYRIATGDLVIDLSNLRAAES